MKKRRALIIFAKFPRAGGVKTRLGRLLGMEQAATVYREFAEHMFSIGRQLSGKETSVYAFYDRGSDRRDIEKWIGHQFLFAVQRGDTLGERMENAFDQTFRDGAGHSIIIGTDVPELDAEMVLRSFEMLPEHDIVIGPSRDGGYYLLGMNTPTKRIFHGIAWSTHAVFQGTMDRVNALGLSYACLPVLDDIDTMEDYHAYLQRKKIS